MESRCLVWGEVGNRESGNGGEVGPTGSGTPRSTLIGSFGVADLGVRCRFLGMVIFSDEACLGYGVVGHPERPERVRATQAFLKETHGEWEWREFEASPEEALLRAHSHSHLHRLEVPERFDEDTAFHEGIAGLARSATGAAMAAMDAALVGERAFSLMRPPGHHAEREQAMGFCYLSHAAVCALEARARGIARVAVWDFDAHHGNGTEAILLGVEGTRYVSCHQHPCYPGTGVVSRENCLNFPIAPNESVERSMEQVRASWEAVLAFQPELVLVSAGFDAYELDPLTQMSLRASDFREIGSWLPQCGVPVAAILEGGYSEDLPQLVEAFLAGWSEE